MRASQHGGNGSWDAWVGATAKDGLYLHVKGDARTIEMYETGVTPERVTLTEDPEGPYYGWIASDSEAIGPIMVQPHKGMFEMQFAYGPKIEQDRGKGRIVRLTLHHPGRAGEGR